MIGLKRIFFTNPPVYPLQTRWTVRFVHLIYGICVDSPDDFVNR
jgi:hypothetical protein